MATVTGNQVPHMSDDSVSLTTWSGGTRYREWDQWSPDHRTLGQMPAVRD